MNCKKCGAPITENDQFCKNCGATVNAQEEQVDVQQVENNNLQSNEPVQDPFSTSSVETTTNSGPVNNVQQSATTSGNNNTKYIVIGVVAVVVVLAGVFLFTKIGGKGDSSNGGSGTVATTVSSKAYKVDFQGFTFDVPDNYIYQFEGDSLVIGDEADSWAVTIQLLEGSYAKAMSNKGKLKSAIESSSPGTNSSEAKVGTFGGTEFLYAEVSQSGQNFLAGYSKVNAMYVAVMTALNLSNEFDTSLFEKVGPIISSATPTQEAKSISSKQAFDFSKISDIAK
ncbi:MAG: zinc ribbon domain-containing protein [Bacilli bacterium]|nr:zinc ribbon domain-containing protein [Bacilli bacterium]